MVLELDDREREVLKYVLESFEEELKSERVRTDKREVRTFIQDEEVVVKRILERVAMSQEVLT